VDELQVAVIVPCYNDGALVTETVDSVKQSSIAAELVVVDDASPDPETHRVLDQLAAGGVKVIRHETNLGVSGARNTGLRETSAPFVFPLDSDDLVPRTALEKMAEALVLDAGAAVAYGDYREFGEHDRLRAVPPTIDTYRLMYTNEYPASALWRRTMLEEVGGWNATRINGYYYEDWDLWLSAAERGERGVHMGAGIETYCQRVHGPRLLESIRREHVPIYRMMRVDHAAVFSKRAHHRRQSDLSRLRGWLYPVVYGRRHRFAFEPKIKGMLDRIGVWTLRR
jgi:glycosyltransferase involved in cell wall biosynthesis